MTNGVGRGGIGKFAEAEKWTAVITAATGAVTAVLGMLGAGDTSTLVSRMVRNEPRLSALGFAVIEVSILLAVVAVGLYAFERLTPSASVACSAF